MCEKTPFLGNFQKLKSDQSLIMSQTNNLNHNLNMILVLKFDDIKKDIENTVNMRKYRGQG